MARIHAPNRDTLVTILLILAGVLLAMTLFGAGAFWKGRTSRHNGNLGRAVPATSVNRFRKSHDSEALLSICRTGLVFVKSLMLLGTEFDAASRSRLTPFAFSEASAWRCVRTRLILQKRDSKWDRKLTALVLRNSISSTRG